MNLLRCPLPATMSTSANPAVPPLVEVVPCSPLANSLQSPLSSASTLLPAVPTVLPSDGPILRSMAAASARLSDRPVPARYRPTGYGRYAPFRSRLPPPIPPFVDAACEDKVSSESVSPTLQAESFDGFAFLVMVLLTKMFSPASIPLPCLLTSLPKSRLSPPFSPTFCFVSASTAAMLFSGLLLGSFGSRMPLSCAPFRLPSWPPPCSLFHRLLQWLRAFCP